MSNQEPKQIKCYCGHTTMCDCGEQPKQETLEEYAKIGRFAEKKYLDRIDNFENVDFKDGVFEGAKWQADRMYSEEDRLKRSDKLWKKLVKELSVLNDNNYTARQLFDYVERHYRQPPLGNNMPPVGEQKCVVPNCKKEPIKEAFHGLCSQHIWPNG
jgi:hypothetical protein